MLDSRKTGWRGRFPCMVVAALFVSMALALASMPAIGLAEEIGAPRGTAASHQQREFGGDAPGGRQGESSVVLMQGQAKTLQEGRSSNPASTGDKLLSQKDYDETGAAEAILQGLKSFTGRINLEAYAVPADGSTIDELFSSIINANPELFYVSNTFSYTYRTRGDVVLELIPTYQFGAEEVATMQAAIDATLNEIESWVPEGADILTKAKVVHDWLVYNVTYDHAAAKSGNSEYDRGTPWNAYGALVERNCVCQGYALAFMTAMRHLGVDAGDVVCLTSETHAWNALRYDGNWYHVDVSWDDPGVTGKNYDWHEISGYADTTYFMKSSAAIWAEDTGKSHASWDPEEIVCDSVTFDDFQWTDYNGAQ